MASERDTMVSQVEQDSELSTLIKESFSEYVRERIMADWIVLGKVR